VAHKKFKTGHLGSKSPLGRERLRAWRSGEAYRRDVPAAEVHVLAAGHFALDQQPDVIADLTRRFLQCRQARTDG
jgi:pimeloyl-ACP methyl ester carboxylesterase